MESVDTPFYYGFGGIGALFLVVAISLLVLSSAGSRAIKDIGLWRIARGYLFVSISAAILAIFLSNNSLPDWINSWIVLTFYSFLTVALFVLPTAIALHSFRRASVFSLTLVSLLFVVPFEAFLYWLSGPMGRDLFLSRHFLAGLPVHSAFFALVGIGFACGARLPLGGKW